MPKLTRSFSGLPTPAVALIPLLILSACQPVARQGPAPIDPAWTTLTAAIQEAVATHDLPALSIALVDGEEVVWAAGFGQARGADLDRAAPPADAETVYRVGSVSKLFTDLAVMLEVQNGRLDLDAPVSDVLPNFRPRAAATGGNPGEITLRQLMSHTSGLIREPPVGHYFATDEPSLDATVASLNSTRLAHAPKTAIKYSNAGIAVVGRALEVSTGQPFAEVLQSQLLQPLEMTSSSFAAAPALASRRAEAVMWGVDAREFAAPTFDLGMAPAGSMDSTVEDLGHFLIALMNPEGLVGPGGEVLLPRPALEQMWTPQAEELRSSRGRSYGLGFALGTLQGFRQIGHGGAIYGFATSLSALPDQRLGVVVTTSRDGANRVTDALAELALRSLLARRDGDVAPKLAHFPSLTQALEAPLGGDLADQLAERSRPLAESAPAPPTPEQAELIGEYGWDHNVLFVFERGGELYSLIEWFYLDRLRKVGADRWALESRLYPDEELRFERNAEGEVVAALLGLPADENEAAAGTVRFERRAPDVVGNDTFRIEPLMPADELRRLAEAASPPVEDGEFRDPDLVELELADDLQLDIRYASTNNFMSTVFYREPRAFLQRPAAEALGRARAALRQRGYGVRLYDGYRPWAVTKMFWDATPEHQRDFVANPASGSRHNRGCAIDLGLFDLETGEVVAMPSGYDEFSARAYPNYPASSSRDNWHRELLRTTMENNGFQVYKFEWWHYDFDEWRQYPLGNLTFEEILSAED